MSVDLDAVLREINALRATLDLAPLTEIPKGTRPPNASTGCAIQRALRDADPHGDVLVGSDAAYVGLVMPNEHRLSPLLQEFIVQFDAGRFPELVLP